MKAKRFLAFGLSLICVFTMVCASAVSGVAASVALPKKVSSSFYDQKGTSTYEFENGNIYIMGDAWMNAAMYPFFIASSTKGQNVNLMQFGSTYVMADIFAALADSALLKQLKPGFIEVSRDETYAFYEPTFEGNRLVSVYYYEQTEKQLNTDYVTGQFKVNYKYDSDGNLTRLSVTGYDFDDFPGAECRDNKFTYKNGKISTAYGVDDGGQFTASSPSFDGTGRLKSFKTNADTQGWGGIKATVSITYKDGKPSTVKVNSSNVKDCNSTTNFTYTNGNLTKISFKGEDNGTYKYTY